jgi:hypothetical protein
VYIHADHCERSVGATAFPKEYLGRALTLLAYGDDRALLLEVRLKNGNEAEEAERLFRNPAVKYVHVRSTDAGCYLFRLDRA